MRVLIFSFLASIVSAAPGYLESYPPLLPAHPPLFAEHILPPPTIIKEFSPPILPAPTIIKAFPPPILPAPTIIKALPPPTIIKAPVLAAPVVKHVAPATSFASFTQVVHSQPIVKTFVAPQPIFKSIAVAPSISFGHEIPLGHGFLHH